MSLDRRTAIRLILALLVVTAIFFVVRDSDTGTPVITPVETELHLETGGEVASYVNASEDDIVVRSPQPGQAIASPLIVEGEARGPWFFEANAGLVLVDWDGRIIAEKYIETLGEWMTIEKVPFRGEMEFETPAYGEGGTVIFRAANPSGLPEHDKSIEIPITFTRE